MLKRTCLVLVALVAWLPAAADDIVVGSFNIEWFGHGNHPRDDDQIAALADYIRALEIDVLACQEINPRGDESGNGRYDWLDLKEELGEDFDAWYGNTGSSQRLAFIWRRDRVALTDIGELKGVDREEVPGATAKSFPRRPLTAHVKSLGGGVDFRIVTVHLYWSVDEARRHEATQLAAWAEGYLASGDDEDLVIIGDCNTKPLGEGETGDSQTIRNLESTGALTCISDTHHEWTTPDSQERYDHAFLSEHLMDTVLVEGSWDVRREVVEVYEFQYKRDISNHVPVTFRILDTDGDAEPAGDWGEN
jgi:endonuclease/exonuclease/phosphatase family metal-dependent hydrolase